jgi:hypothetical protein
MYGSLVLVCIGVLAVPCSVVFPLIAVKLWERFVEPRMRPPQLE